MIDGKCTIIQILRGRGNHPTVLAELDGITIPQLNKLQDMGTLAITLRKFNKKRSLNANSYYWKLCRELAHAMDTSEEEMHNQLIDRYGVYRIDDDGNLIPHFLPENVDYLKKKHEHYKPTGVRVVYEGITYCKYWELKGSSNYDTKEMSNLIEGLVSECKDLDIETLRPEEIERMMKEYAKKNDKISSI